MNTTPNNEYDVHDEEAKLTAFVLGELPEEEAAAMEAALAEDDTLKQELEGLRETVGALTGALNAEPAPGLTEDQRASIERGEAPGAEPEPPVVFSFVRSHRFWAGTGLAAAACIAVVLAVPMFDQSRDQGRFAVAPAETSVPAESTHIEMFQARAGKELDEAPRAVAEAEALDFSYATGDVVMDDLTPDVEMDTTAFLGIQTVTDKDGAVAADAPALYGDIATVGQQWKKSAEGAPGVAGSEPSETVALTPVPTATGERVAGRRARGLAGGGGGTPTAAPAAGVDRRAATAARDATPAAKQAAPPRRTALAAPSAPPAAPPTRVSETEDRQEGGASVRFANTGEPVLAGALLQPLTPAQIAQLTRKQIADRLPQVAEGRKLARKAGNVELEAQFRGEFDQLMTRMRRGGRPEAYNREAYNPLIDNPFIRADQQQLSTLSADVDTASYANIRRMLTSGQLPPKDAVRIEELINYFDYAYEPPSGGDPFSVGVEVAACPWNPEHRLARIGLKGRTIDRDMRPATNLVFLVDVSGSMNDANKLPLVQQSLKLLVDHLTADDRIAMVVYAGSAGLVLESTYCDQRDVINAAIDNLRAGGSTNGGQGIELAYDVARDHFIKGGVNRVILCTDGDFNVGTSDQGSLDRLIAERRDTGVFLSVLGFGTGNWQDARMESLSNKGNGNFSYIDHILEAEKALVNEMSGTLVTIAKDVKIQVDFNPTQVAAYRLIGYANRLLAAEDFKNDKKDAGEIGAGHTVTVFYEIIPAGAEHEPAFAREAPKSRYVAESAPVDDAEILKELFNVKLRYKQPDADVSEPTSEEVIPVLDSAKTVGDATGDFRFAAAVAGFGMVLRDSEYKGTASYATVLDLATAGTKDDKWRAEFVQLVQKAKALSGE
ncbi:MAG: YfbK domain-containing protein [Planctomycetota bacterium]|jgi:Ca-activated chloride channel family protein